MAERGLRVLNFVPDPRWGGPHARVAMVAAKLREWGIDTTVLSSPGPAVAEFIRRGVPAQPFPFARPRLARPVTSGAACLVRLLPDALRLAALIRRQDFDVLHCNGILNVTPPLGGRLAGVKVLCHLNDTMLPRPVYRGLVRVLGVFTNGFVYSARAVADYAGHGDCTDDVIMFPPVEMSRFARTKRSANPPDGILEGLDPAGPIAVMVANVNRGKGHMVALQALRMLHDRGLPVQGLFVGKVVDEATWASLSQYLRDARLERHVRFVGFHANVQDYLAAATVFVLTSLAEGMPIAVLEAMAAGLPCVVTGVGGVAEAVVHGRTGMIVDVGSVEQVADAVSAVVTDRGLGGRMGEEGRLVVAERFSLDAVARKQAAVYRRLCGRGSAEEPRSGEVRLGSRAG